MHSVFPERGRILTFSPRILLTGCAVV